MSEILTEALLNEIKRLKGIDFEGLSDSVLRLDKSMEAVKKVQVTVNDNMIKLETLINKVDIPHEIKITRHLTIGAKDKYFGIAIICCFLFLLVAFAGVTYGVKQHTKLETSEESLATRTRFIEWVRTEKRGEELFQKYFKIQREPKGENNKQGK